MGLKIEELREKIRPTTKAIICNFPHNPTGATLARQAFQGLIDLARRHNLFLFSDEMYRFLEYASEACLPSACEISDQAISLFGMSKTLLSSNRLFFENAFPDGDLRQLSLLERILWRG